MIVPSAPASEATPGPPLKLVIGSDHAGFPLKGPVIGVKLAEEVLRAYLNARFSTDEDFRRRVRKLEDLAAFRPEK